MKKIKIQNGLTVVPETIKWVEADINYSILHFENKKSEMCSVTLKTVEKVLESDMFYRIHRMYLVNFVHIERINMRNKTVVISNREFPVARRRFKAFKQALSRELLSEN